MPSRVNDVPWMQEGGAVVAAEEDEDGRGGGLLLGEIKDVPGFKPILDEDWFLAAGSSGHGDAAAGGRPNHGFVSVHGYERQDVDDVTFSADPSPPGSMLLQPVDSSTSSCSPPPSVFDLEKSLPFFAQSSSISSLFNAVCSNPFDTAAFEQGYGAAFLPAAQMSSSAVLLNSGGGGGMLRFASLGPSGHAGPPDLIPAAQFRAARPVPLLESGGFGFFDDSPFFHKSKVLQPLEISPPVGAPPTLFQKRAATALRRGSPAPGDNGFAAAAAGEKDWTFLKSVNGGDAGEADVDCPDLYYDSDEVAAGEGKVEENTNPGGDGNASNANSTVTGGDGDHKGKKKRMPAKNLMAERRRRKKLNDRLYMLRSVVPKISKMDRASILGDAIEYLKELLQRINDLHNELESTPCGSPLASVTTTSFHPLTPTLPCRVKEELWPSPLPSPSSQVPKVEVGEREGQGVNIHMLCARRPGLLLSTMKALDSLGLDIQQAVISCFNGFALDVFRAEQCKDGPGVRSEEIKAVLLHCVGCHDTI